MASRVPLPTLAAFFKFALQSEEAAEQRYEPGKDTDRESDMCEQGKEHRRFRLIADLLRYWGSGGVLGAAKHLQGSVGEETFSIHPRLSDAGESARVRRWF